MVLFVRTIPTSPFPLPLRRTGARAQSRGGKDPELMPNARRRKHDPLWTGGGFSLGVDLGNSRTGLAIGMHLALPRPLKVLKMQGQELEARLVKLAEEEDADELIVGLPRSLDGAETAQSSKVRAFVRKLAVPAAQRGLRVYLQDEHGTSKDALDYMIDIGVRRSARRGQLDAYSAVMVLERYFEMSGFDVELVLPNQPELRQKLRARVRSQKEDDLWNDLDKPGKDFFPTDLFGL